ncbi:MAG: hypothetical protein RL742_389, partial [Bacteroidota bacterium]
MLRLLLASLFLSFQLLLAAQGIEWAPAGHSYYALENDAILQYDLPNLTATTIAGTEQLRPAGSSKPLAVESFQFSADNRKLLLYTNSARVWRYNTRGDYWVLDLVSGSLTQLGKGLPGSSLMFAKFSPDGAKVAYVSQRNLYVEELPSGKITRLTETDGTPKLINGTFDWVYEEEFDCRDGFRWRPDSKAIAYWQIDA